MQETRADIEAALALTEAQTKKLAAVQREMRELIGELRGDLMAQIAAARTAERKMRSIVSPSPSCEAAPRAERD